MTALANRYDIVFLFDVTNGNPNCDSDAGNMPRMHPDTNRGLVSDVSLKRKIRNYTELTKCDQPGYRIYVQEGSILNEKHREAYKAVRGERDKVGKDSKLNPQNDDESKSLTKFMCDASSMSAPLAQVAGPRINAGQVRGPVRSLCQLQWDHLPLEISITRMAATNEKAERLKGDEGDGGQKIAPMGRKHIDAYGLIAPTSLSTPAGRRTSFGDADRPSVRKSGSMSSMTDRQPGEMSSRRGIFQARLGARQCPCPRLVRARPGASEDR
jgi:CRISPR-associated protein Csd2